MRSTGCRSLIDLLGLDHITLRYSPWVTSYLPTQIPGGIETGTMPMLFRISRRGTEEGAASGGLSSSVFGVTTAAAPSIFGVAPSSAFFLAAATAASVLRCCA